MDKLEDWVERALKGQSISNKFIDYMLKFKIWSRLLDPAKKGRQNIRNDVAKFDELRVEIQKVERKVWLRKSDEGGVSETNLEAKEGKPDK